VTAPIPPLAFMLFAAAPPPAEPAGSSGDGGGFLVAVLALLLLAVAGVVVALRVRSWARDRSLGEGGSGFTLEELQALRDRGELTEAQWQAARRSVLERSISGAPSTQGPETRSQRPAR
jgi:hypothetical protein